MYDNTYSPPQRGCDLAELTGDPFLCFRMANARAKAEGAEEAAERSLKDSELARVKAKEFAPEFVQPGICPNPSPNPNPTPPPPPTLGLGPGRCVPSAGFL